MVTAGQLVKLLDVVYAPSTQIPKTINKQLSIMYNKLKVILNLEKQL